MSSGKFSELAARTAAPQRECPRCRAARSPSENFFGARRKFFLTQENFSEACGNFSRTGDVTAAQEMGRYAMVRTYRGGALGTERASPHFHWLSAAARQSRPAAGRPQRPSICHSALLSLLPVRDWKLWSHALNSRANASSIFAKCGSQQACVCGFAISRKIFRAS